MLIFHKVTDIQKYLSKKIWNHYQIGFVPTMGALHEGHLSIIKKSKAENEVTVSSIFVNPTQFNNQDDYQKYPKTIGSDIEKLAAAQTDMLFLPDVAEMYPNGTAYNLPFDAGYFDTVMEGAFRPGHFKGVAQIVKRLLDIIQPTTLYLGQKDYQQFMVVKKMIADLNIPVKLKMSPTIREANGLAMSSRNMRLSETEKAQAAIIHEVLRQTASELQHKSVAEAVESAMQKIQQIPGAKPEYVVLAHAETLEILHEYSEKTPSVICIAVWINGVRLIDNIIL